MYARSGNAPGFASVTTTAFDSAADAEPARIAATTTMGSEQSFHRWLCAILDSSVISAPSRKRLLGRSIPRCSNLVTKTGRRPVERSAPTTVPSGENESILNAEQILERDHVGLHALHLGDRRHPTRAVLQPLEVDDHVESRGHLLADRLHRQVVACHQHHGLDAAERVAWRVGVEGREGALVARVHRLEHVQCLGASDLADDDAVGAHAQ